MAQGAADIGDNDARYEKRTLYIAKEPRADEDKRIIPPLAHGVHCLSSGMLVDEGQAVIWRGPMVHSLVRQFLSDVDWGELDYLFLDLPPGTGDVQLTVAQDLDVSGAVIVSTPQDVALLDSRKSISFCREIKIPLIGVVENMSGLLRPHCGKEIDLFKTGGGERIAGEMKVLFLGRVPLDPLMVMCGDEGRPFVETHPDSRVTAAFADIAGAWEKQLGCK